MVGGTAHPGLRPGTLAGCQAECDVIAQALARLADGRSQVVELTGDPGIGKTRLLTEVARRGAEHGFLVLDGRAQHSGERVPFYALVDALDDHLAGLDLWGPEADRDVLASIFPSLRRPGMENAGPTCERYPPVPGGPGAAGIPGFASACPAPRRHAVGRRGHRGAVRPAALSATPQACAARPGLPEAAGARAAAGRGGHGRGRRPARLPPARPAERGRGRADARRAWQPVVAPRHLPGQRRQPVLSGRAGAPGRGAGAR
jgi:AAA ATPase domain